MSLSHHIRAMNALGDAFERQAALSSIEADQLLLMSIATAHRAAAQELLAESKAEAETFATAHRCTVEHATMKWPLCPVCKAPRR